MDVGDDEGRTVQLRILLRGGDKSRHPCACLGELVDQLLHLNAIGNAADHASQIGGCTRGGKPAHHAIEGCRVESGGDQSRGGIPRLVETPGREPVGHLVLAIGHVEGGVGADMGGRRREGFSAQLVEYRRRRTRHALSAVAFAPVEGAHPQFTRDPLDRTHRIVQPVHQASGDCPRCLYPVLLIEQLVSRLPIDEHALQHVHRHRKLGPYESPELGGVDRHESRAAAHPNRKVVALRWFVEKRRDRSAIASSMAGSNRLDVSAAGTLGHQQLSVDQHEERRRWVALEEEGSRLVFLDRRVSAKSRELLFG